MAILDCETYESTITSICQIYNTDKNEVVSFLTGIDLDAEYARSNISQDCDEYIKFLFETRFGSPSTEIDAVMWFHLTRTLKNSDFSEGILPLGIALEKVWKILLSILKEPEQRKNLTIMQASGVENQHFNLKLKDRIHHGPYAMLIRDTAFRSKEVGNSDYLKLPEIIEDICTGYKEKFGHSITETVIENLNACIVKFKSDKKINYGLLAPAILYCWTVIKNDEFGQHHISCFDSKCIPILRSQIVSVDFL